SKRKRRSEMNKRWLFLFLMLNAGLFTLPSCAPAGRPAPEKVLHGIGVSYGIAIGPAFLVQLDRPRVPLRALDGSEVSGEQQRFESAVLQAQRELGELKEQSANL